MQQGAGRQYRERSWLERIGSASASFAPAWLRRRLRGPFNSALAKMPGDSLSCTLPGGESVRVDPEFRQLAWNPEEYAALKAAVRPGATVFDVGANVGAYTLLFATWAGDAGRVVAFEPAPASRQGLLRHIALNQLSHRVVVEPQAVSDRTGTFAFKADGAQGDNRLLAGPVVGGVMVPTLTLDDFCASRQLDPDVIKIDVEGSELAALRGARRTIEKRRGSLALFVELHPAIWPLLGYTRADLEEELRIQGLRVEALPGISDPWAIEGVSVRLRAD